MPTIKPQTNIPIECRLQSINPELAPSNFGDPQYKFITDQGLLYVGQGAGNVLVDQIRKANIQANEPVEICKREVVNGQRKTIRWEITKVGFIPGEQPGRQDLTVGPQHDGSFVVGRVTPINRNGNGGNGVPGAGVVAPAPAQAATNGQQPATNGNGNPKANGNGSGNHHAPEANIHQGWAQFLLSQTNTLTDVYAAALEYAGSRYGNLVKPEDVKTLMTTAFINLSKGGGCNVA